jgi:putative endonuclease
MKRGGAVYILCSQRRTTLYCGVTENLQIRIKQHKEHYFKDSFTDKYNINQLVYYELFHSIEEAIAREKQIKGYSRVKKEKLIEAMNPSWTDFYEKVMRW